MTGQCEQRAGVLQRLDRPEAGRAFLAHHRLVAFKEGRRIPDHRAEVADDAEFGEALDILGLDVTGMGDVMPDRRGPAEVADRLDRIEHLGDGAITGTMDLEAHAKPFGLVDHAHHLGQVDQQLAAMAMRIGGVGDIGVVEGGCLRAGHAVEEDFGEVRPDMRGAMLVADGEQFIAGRAEQEGRLDERQRGDGPGREFA
jgi:hypothetical protein